MLQRRHADVYLALAEKAEVELLGPEQDEWLERLERDHEDLRAAFRWAMARSDVVTALRLSSALWRFWLLRGYAEEGLRLLEAAIAKGGSVQPVLRAKAISAAANLASGVEDYNRALELQREALGLYRELGDRRREALTIESLGGLAMQLDDHDQARTFFEQCLEMFEAMGDIRHIAVTLDSLAALAYERGHLEGARSLYQDSLARFRELGGEADIAASLNNLATVVSKQEEYDQARRLYEESLSLFRRLGDQRGVATAIVNLAVLLARVNQDYERAVALATEGLDLFARQGAREEIADCLRDLAEVASQHGNSLAAASLIGAAHTLRQMIGEEGDRRGELLAAEARARLDDATFHIAWSQGREVALKLAIAYDWTDEEPEEEEKVEQQPAWESTRAQPAAPDAV